MDPIDRLKHLDRRRKRLNAYEARVRMAFWMPATRDRVLARLSKKFRQASEERTRVLGHINADPALRKRLRDVENAESAAPKLSKRSPSAAPQHVTNEPAPTVQRETRKQAGMSRDLLENQALYVISLKTAERHAKEAYQRAVWYYKWADWKRDSVPVEEVTGLLDRLKGDLHRSTKERALAQDSFEGAVREATPANSHHILYREELLASVPASEPAGSVRNAFDQWLEQRGGKQEPDYAEDEPTY